MDGRTDGLAVESPIKSKFFTICYGYKSLYFWGQKNEPFARISLCIRAVVRAPVSHFFFFFFFFFSSGRHSLFIAPRVVHFSASWFYIIIIFYQNQYRNDPKFSDRYAWANSADPDQTEEQSGQSLHCLPFHLHRLDTSLYWLRLIRTFFFGCPNI